MNKKLLISMTILSLPIVGIQNTFAGGVENLSNFSTEYARTLNRNAATDSVDAVVYNPAGTVLMDNGSYIGGGLQYIQKDYKNIITGTSNGDDDTYSQDEPSLVPSLFALYKQDQWSYYGAITIPSGGGKVKFNEGNATSQVANILLSLNPGFSALKFTTLTDSSTNAESKGVGMTFGTAYLVNEKLSVSFGLRHLTSDKNIELNFTTGAGAAIIAVDYKAEASGISTILGVNYKASDELNLSARYETATELDYKYTINSGTNATGTALLSAQGITNNLKKRLDLPGVLALGASYQINPQLKLDVNLTQYLQKDADWAGAEDKVDNGTDIGFALEYVFNDKMRGSFGYLRTDTGQKTKDTLAEAPKLNATSYAAGFAYNVDDNFVVNTGITMSSYDSDSYLDATGLTIAYEKSVTILSAGIQYKF